jgi:hypothetical protein
MRYVVQAWRYWVEISGFRMMGECSGQHMIIGMWTKDRVSLVTALRLVQSITL